MRLPNHLKLFEKKLAKKHLKSFWKRKKTFRRPSIGGADFLSQKKHRGRRCLVSPTLVTSTKSFAGHRETRHLSTFKWLCSTIQQAFKSHKSGRKNHPLLRNQCPEVTKRPSRDGFRGVSEGFQRGFRGV